MSSICIWQKRIHVTESQTFEHGNQLVAVWRRLAAVSSLDEEWCWGEALRLQKPQKYFKFVFSVSLL